MRSGIKALTANHHWVLGYCVAVLSVLAALGLKLLIDPLIEKETPFLFFFAAIMVSAWYGGFGPGVLASFLAIGTTDYFFLYPIGSFSGLSLETTPLVVFFLEGVLASLLASKLRSAKQRAERSTQRACEQQERLRKSEQKIRELVGKILIAQEEERRRIAYEVHDGFAQMAVATYQLLQNFADDYPQASAEATEELEEAVARLGRTIEEARHVIADLRPPVLDDLGLAAALRQKADVLRADEGLKVRHEIALGEERLPAGMEIALFRIAQEALANVCKHSKSGLVRLVLERAGGSVKLYVQDWGLGFRASEETNGGARGERMGLHSMKERAALLGGTLEILSEPGSGTLVKADIPLPAKEETGHGG